MNRMTDEVRQEYLWTKMFADDFVICNESREPTEDSLQKSRQAPEKRQMKDSRSKTGCV